MISRKDFLKRASLFMGAVVVADMLPKLASAEMGLGAAKRARRSGAVNLAVPTIAESGANVPVTVSVAKPVGQVKAIHIFVDRNPAPYAMGVKLTNLSGKAYLAGRIKIGKTSTVRAVVQLKNGQTIQNTRTVKVTVGGCG